MSVKPWLWQWTATLWRSCSTVNPAALYSQKLPESVLKNWTNRPLTWKKPRNCWLRKALRILTATASLKKTESLLNWLCRFSRKRQFRKPCRPSLPKPVSKSISARWTIPRKIWKRANLICLWTAILPLLPVTVSVFWSRTSPPKARTTTANTPIRNTMPLSPNWQVSLTQPNASSWKRKPRRSCCRITRICSWYPVRRLS